MIDCHVHLWDRALLGSSEAARDSLAYFRTPLEQVPETLSDLVEDLEAAGVEKAFLLAMDCSESPEEPLRNLSVRNEAVGEAIQEHPDLFVGFGSVDPRKGDRAVEELEDAVVRFDLQGLKFHACTLGVRPDDRELMYPLYEKAQDMGLRILHHTGTTSLSHCLISYARPVALDAVAYDFPQLPILLAHFGWPWMEECFAVLMRHPNLYTDISGWAPRYLPERTVQMINGPLKGRTLAGSDYPMLAPAVWRDGFEEALRPRLKEGVAEALLVDNAKAFLRA